MTASGQTLEVWPTISYMDTTALALFNEPTTLEPATVDEWREALHSLYGFHSNYQWMVGDLILWARAQYAQDPDPALRALWTEAAEILDADQSTISQWVQMADLFPPAERRTVSYRHHRAVFSLPEIVRLGLLDQAVVNGWTTRQIEAAAKTAKQEIAALEDELNPRLGETVPDVEGRDVATTPDTNTTPEAPDVTAPAPQGDVIVQRTVTICLPVEYGDIADELADVFEKQGLVSVRAKNTGTIQWVRGTKAG